MEYFLEPHVFVGLSNRHVVILDVHRDRYACVLREQFERLGPWLNGWEGACSVGRGRPDCPEAAAAEVARMLVSQCILTLDPVRSKPVRSVRAPAPKDHTTSDGGPSRLALLAKTPAFFFACHRANLALQRMRFETVVEHVASRHATQERPPLVTPASKARATHLVAIFDALRPMYPRPYLCTFDSLALLEFLAGEGEFPRWIFAVRADPFHAHCWVQYGQTLLNDRVERIARLTPIMVV